MGLDMKYQAMPEGCDLLKRSRQEPEFANPLEFFSSIAREGTKFSDAVWQDFSTAARQTIEQYPGLETRYLFWDRCWNKLYYLLSENRRQENCHPAPGPNLSLVEKAIFGGDAIHPNAQTTSGFRIRYLPSKDISEISDFLAEITSEMLYRHFDPVAMSKVGVYKMRGDEDDKEREWIQQNFEKLREFYVQAAAHNEGVITCLS